MLPSTIKAASLDVTEAMAGAVLSMACRLPAALVGNKLFIVAPADLPFIKTM